MLGGSIVLNHMFLDIPGAEDVPAGEADPVFAFISAFLAGEFFGGVDSFEEGVDGLCLFGGEVGTVHLGVHCKASHFVLIHSCLSIFYIIRINQLFVILNPYPSNTDQLHHASDYLRFFSENGWPPAERSQSNGCGFTPQNSSPAFLTTPAGSRLGGTSPAASSNAP